MLVVIPRLANMNALLFDKLMETQRTHSAFGCCELCTTDAAKQYIAGYLET